MIRITDYIKVWYNDNITTVDDVLSQYRRGLLSEHEMDKIFLELGYFGASHKLLNEYNIMVKDGTVIYGKETSA